MPSNLVSQSSILTSIRTSLYTYVETPELTYFIVKINSLTWLKIPWPRSGGIFPVLFFFGNYRKRRYHYNPLLYVEEF